MADATPSFDEIYAIGKAEAQAERPALTFLDGDQTTAVVRGGAAMVDHAIGWMAGEIRKMLYGGAVRDELDAIIMDRQNIPRTPATPARGDVWFQRSGAGSAGTIAAATELQGATDPSTGRKSSYTTDGALSYPSGAFTLKVTARCSASGKVGNLTPPSSSGTALTITTTLSDTSITAFTTGFAGGNDVETDTNYLFRAVNHFLTERRGTVAALEEGALEAEGVAVAHVVEDRETGLVEVRVADSTGESTLEMTYRAVVALETWRAAGVSAEARGMHAAQLQLTIYIMEYAPGFSVEAAAPTIIASVTNRCGETPPGQTLTLDTVRTAIIGPYATQITKIAFANPLGQSGIVLDGTAVDYAADIKPDDGKAIHLVDGGVTIVDGKAQ
jgi:uncharacterized phage protein gp47/JayE